MNEVQCPHCRAVLYDDGSMPGQPVACPTCNGHFQMPLAFQATGHQATQPPAVHTVYSVALPTRSPGLAAVLSFFYPGLGQIYNGQIIWGILYMVTHAILCVMALATVGLLLPLPVAFWLASIYDARNDAEKYNQSVLRSQWRR